MCRAVVRYREIVLATVFLGMASYELFEFWMLELPRGSALSLTILVHALQVLVILGAAGIVLRAWLEKTAHEQALACMVEKVVFAQEEERRRIAYDVHDGIAQLIVSAKQHVDTCADLWHREPDRAARELTTGLDRLQRAIVETRRVLTALGPSAVASTGLVEALRISLDEAAQERGWAVSLTTDVGDSRFEPAVETAMFRIFQEALANVARHARALRVDITLRREEDWLLLDIRDGGVGFIPADDFRSRRGLGLLSMRERARLLGGTCTIESAPDEGTRVSVRLPLRNGQANGHGE